MQQVVNKLSSTPRHLFLMDALGALFSIFLLGFVLVKLETIFGIPKSALYVLASLPCFFIVYDLLCYFLVKNRVGLFLKGIATLNLLYCFISVIFAIYHKEAITTLGWIYIFIEIVVLLLIVKIEFEVASSSAISSD